MEPLKAWIVQILNGKGKYFDEMAFVGYSADIPKMRERARQRWSHKWESDGLTIGLISGTPLDRDFSNGL